MLYRCIVKTDVFVDLRVSLMFLATNHLPLCHRNIRDRNNHHGDHQTQRRWPLRHSVRILHQKNHLSHRCPRNTQRWGQKNRGINEEKFCDSIKFQIRFTGRFVICFFHCCKASTGKTTTESFETLIRFWYWLLLFLVVIAVVMLRQFNSRRLHHVTSPIPLLDVQRLPRPRGRASAPAPSGPRSPNPPNRRGPSSSRRGSPRKNWTCGRSEPSQRGTVS